MTTHKYRFDDLIKKINSNENSIKNLNKKNIHTTSNYSLKNHKNIYIINDQNANQYYNDNTIHFHAIVDGFPEWVIPFVKIIFDIYSPSDIEVDINNNNQFLTKEFYHHWQPITLEKTTDSLYTLYIDAYARFREKLIVPGGFTTVDKPLNMNLYLNILNERIWHEIQPKKV